ncbi:uncharacterized protein LOC107019339 [Solanum pennellii]|uniref:Uncharacterized protein LOC107019339 n=1 Tax=Solanum pennellii TaxID=28526 RepID=A0ABM1GSP5_SOLPN|nr:uncharacterized protein LOC107019339 [Solanum pennellii]
MAPKDGNESDNDEEIQNQMTSHETGTTEEIRVLRQQMADMYEAWMSGQPPPSSIREYFNTNMSHPIQVSTSDPIYPPGFSPYANTFNVAGTSMGRPSNTPVISNPLFVSTAPTNSIPQPTMVPKSNSDPPPKVRRDQSYTLEEAIKIPSSHPHIHQYSSPVEIERMVKNEEHEEMNKKMKSLEQSIRDMQGLGGHKGISFSDLCMFPHVHLPAGFKTPKFEKYDGHGDPIAHLKRYCNQLRGAEGKEELLMAYFGESLVGIASEWFIDQDITNWHTWDDLARCFVQQFQYNIDIVPDRSSLANMRKKTTENFREYAIRWREQAARVKPPMKESEMIDVFLQAQEPDYFHYLLSAVGKTFAEVIKVGEMVENGIKSGKIVSQAALKATTQVLQNGSGNIGGKKRREDVATIVSAPRTHVQGNFSQHYFPSQAPQYSVPYTPYHVFNAQPIAPPSYPQRRAPTPQNHPPPPQVHQNTARIPFRPRPQYKKGNGVKDEFTPIGESYASLFHKLRTLNVLSPIERKMSNPPPRNLDYSQHCAYCSNAAGHNIERCWYLKRAIQDLIDSNRIIVESSSGPNINQNPLPRHTETNMLEMMKGHEEFASPYKPILRVGTGIKKSANVVDLTKMMPLGAENELEKLSPSNTPILTVKGALEDVWESPSKAKSFVPKRPNKPILIVQGAHVPLVIIRPVSQLPMTNPKAVPWSYEPTVVTYKGKEIDEEIDGVGGITRSGRCYVPMELRKTRNDQTQIKSSVTEGEAEEFLRKMKLSDYSVVEQLRKTPAQISLLSLLIHSDEHRKAVMKILNEAHVPSKVTVSQLQKIAGRIFEVNRITFSDDELPKEGSGANICPLSTLQKLNVSAERVRPNNVCVRAFDGSKTDVIGEIKLVLTIGPVDFAVNFQVLDINASYNLLLGRPWVHRAGAAPSTLHQMIKFEYDRQEVIVHGEGGLSIYKDSSFPFIKADNENEALLYQASEVVVIEHVPEGSVISKPNMPIASVMVVNELLKHGFGLGKDLGIFLQGRAYPVSLRKSIGTFGLGYQPRIEDKMKAKKHKRDVWSLTKPIQPIYKSFIKARATESYQSSFPEPVMKVSEEMINYFQDLFVEVDMVELGEGTSDRDVQFIGPDVNLNNWEATPLPVKDESCSFYADSSDMTCMQNFSPDLNIQSNLRPNIEIISQEIEYDEDRVFEEVKKDFNHFENKRNPNMSETETINLGDQEIIKETKISVHVRHQKDDIIQALLDYKDVFASSYDNMPGLSTDMVKLRKLKTDMSAIIKEEITKQLEAKVIEVSQNPSWLANIIPVPQKDGKVRMCVDYRDLNKASPKDVFPLPNIHILLGSCAKHEDAFCHIMPKPKASVLQIGEDHSLLKGYYPMVLFT